MPNAKRSDSITAEAVEVTDKAVVTRSLGAGASDVVSRMKSAIQVSKVTWPSSYLRIANEC